MDGTGRLLFRQQAVFDAYDVSCVSYPHATPRSYDELAGLAEGRLEQSGPGVVLAESFGGPVALTLALRRPDLVRRMLLINTFAHYPRRLLIRLGVWLGRLLPARPSPRGSRRLRGYFFFTREIPPDERVEWWEQTADVPMSAFGHRVREVAAVDLRPLLPSIRIPALVVAAPNDRVVPCRAGVELARLLPNARLLRPRVGHAAMIHPLIDVARMLADPSLWPDGQDAETADGADGSSTG
jgi:pimeloyl-ACP methyl ester carboxylesterase